MSPHTAMSQPAPAATRSSRTLNVKPLGAPFAAGSLLQGQRRRGQLLLSTPAAQPQHALPAPCKHGRQGGRARPSTHEKEYCVLAMHTGRPAKPCRVYVSSAASASAENSTPPAPYTLCAMASILSCGGG